MRLIRVDGGGNKRGDDEVDSRRRMEELRRRRQEEREGSETSCASVCTANGRRRMVKFCKCGVETPLLTSKTGVNPGRRFYGCGLYVVCIWFDCGSSNLLFAFLVLHEFVVCIFGPTLI